MSHQSPRSRDHAVERRPQKIAFGEMRSTGVRGVLVYCGDYKCAHHVEINADRWSDEVRLSDLEPAAIAAEMCGRSLTMQEPRAD